MAEKKISPIALLDILTSRSDEDHILTAQELIEAIKEKYDVDIERRTIYSNIDLLRKLGYVISDYEDNGKGYFLEEKQFEKGEVLLLCNAIHASHFISKKQSSKLINKLLKTLSVHEAKEFKDNVYLPNNQKKENNELMYNIALVSEAIRDRKLIQFTYNHYDINKQLISNREEPYIVEPRYIVYSDSRPYLISTNKKYTDFTHYRLDKIKNAFLLEEKAKILPKRDDAYEYAKNKLFMFNGETEEVIFLCDNDIMDHMVDLLGDDFVATLVDDKHFEMSIKTSKKGAIYLAQQYLDSLEIIKPIDLRLEFKKELELVLNRYKK